jgi:DDE superfamily endonuclease
MGQTRRPGGADPDRDSGDPKLVDAAYPASTAIKVIRDNHSAHISKETKAWLASQPAGRFEFTFTPKHGSWLNLVEGFGSCSAGTAIGARRKTSTSIDDHSYR